MSADPCGDFSRVRIEWSAHGDERSKERVKPRAVTEAAIRSSQFQQPARKGRCRVLGCVGNEMTAIVVKRIGQDRIVVVSVVGYGKPCK